MNRAPSAVHAVTCSADMASRGSSSMPRTTNAGPHEVVEPVLATLAVEHHGLRESSGPGRSGGPGVPVTQPCANRIVLLRGRRMRFAPGRCIRNGPSAFRTRTRARLSASTSWPSRCDIVVSIFTCGQRSDSTVSSRASSAEALADGGELPRGVVRVTDAGLHALAGPRRHQV